MAAKPPRPTLPTDSKGRVLWARVSGFREFMQAEASAMTNAELEEAILAHWGRRLSVQSLMGIRDRYNVTMDPQTRRRAYEKRSMEVAKQMEVLPSFVRERGPNDPDFMKVTGDCFVTGDWHLPYVHEQMLDRLLQLADRLDIRQLVIAGDFLNQDAFSKWKWHRFNVNWDYEKHSARATLERLYRVFRTIFYVMDNHDRRIIVANEKTGQFTEQDVIDLLTHGVRVGTLNVGADYHYLLINNLWRVTCPKEYRRVKLSLPARIAQLHQQHVLAAGDHLWAIGLDDSGKFVIANNACMTDPKLTPYTNVQDTTYPIWGPGFHLIRRNVLYPFSSHPALTDWDFWLPPAGQRRANLPLAPRRQKHVKRHG